VLGDDNARAETAAALESARGVLRSEVGKQTQVRFTPTLTFVLDGVLDNVQHIDELLAKAREADAAVHEVASRAEPAGEADPYRVARDAAE
jgi:ribosome-binding factor A